MTIEAVVFDIGNVLIEWHPERYFDRTIGSDKRRALFSEVDLHGMNDRIDLGEGFEMSFIPWQMLIQNGAQKFKIGMIIGSNWPRHRLIIQFVCSGHFALLAYLSFR